MKNNITVYILVSVSVLVLIVGGTLLVEEKKKTEQILSLYKQSENDKIDLRLTQNYRNMEILLNGKNMAKEIKISDGKGNYVDLIKIIDNDKLVLFFPEGSCEDCVNAEISKLNDRVGRIGANNIVILIAASNKRFVAQYKINNKLKYSVYEAEVVQKDLFSSLLPLYFIIERENMRINTAYIPLRERPEKTNHFLDKIFEDYFEAID